MPLCSQPDAIATRQLAFLQPKQPKRNAVVLTHVVLHASLCHDAQQAVRNKQRRTL